MAQKRDYYEVLGVSKQASADEIKKAFYKQAAKHHPDKGGDSDKFKEANEAYQTLSDTQKRAQYDRFGADGPQSGFGGASSNGAGFGGFDFSGFQQGGVEFDMGDIEDMLGGMFGGAFSGQGRSSKGADIALDITLTLADVRQDFAREITYSRNESCATCKGTRAKPGTEIHACTICNGTGTITKIMMGVFQQRSTCTTCHGSGKIPKEKCTTCKGVGTEKKSRTISVTIPKGTEDGQTLRMPGGGEVGPKGTAGDLYLRIHIAEDKVWRREGSHLVATRDILLTESLLGATLSVPYFGNTLDVVIPCGTRHGDVIQVSGKGMPSRYGSGNAHVVIHVKTPKKLTKDQEKIIKQLADLSL